MNIAIDGPAGAGKSTIAKLVAKEKGYIYVDTGAMYRGCAIYMINQGYTSEDTEKIANTISDVKLSIKYVDGAQHVFVNDKDVTDGLREEAVGSMASVVAAIPEVRAALLDTQRRIAYENDAVMDGRDIGTTVLPDADLKIYLTASSAVRAKRRYDELLAKGEAANIDIIEKDIIERDMRDMNRSVSPLKKAADAIEIISDDMTIEEVKNKIIALINK